MASSACNISSSTVDGAAGLKIADPTMNVRWGWSFDPSRQRDADNGGDAQPDRQCLPDRPALRHIADGVDAHMNAAM